MDGVGSSWKAFSIEVSRVNFLKSSQKTVNPIYLRFLCPQPNLYLVSIGINVPVVVAAVATAAVGEGGVHSDFDALG